MNNTIRILRNQLFQEKTFTLSEEIKKNPLSFFIKKPVSFLRVLKYLFKLSNNHKRIITSAEVIARDAGCSVDHVYDLIKEMWRLGLINIHNRGSHKGKWLANEYDLNPMFYDYDIRFDLQELFWPLKYLHFNELTGWIGEKNFSPQTSLLEYPQQNKNEVILKNNNLSLSEKESIIKRPGFQIPPFLKQVHEKRQEQHVQFPKKGNTVKQSPKPPTSSPMKDSQCLLKLKNLTSANIYGQIAMSAFDPLALSYAIRKMEDGKGVGTDPFTVFFRNCMTYSKARQLPIDYQHARSLAQKHNMPDQPSYGHGRPRRSDDVKIDAIWQEKEKGDQ